MLIGLTGSFGAGKGAVVEYLKEKGFAHYSARAYIVEKLNEEGKEVNRDSMIAMGNTLREKYGPGHVLETLIERANNASENVVVESLRAVAEVHAVRAAGGFILGVDADPKVRYERAYLRGSETDNVSFEEWKQQEDIENNTEDPTKQNIQGALALSDVVVMNDGSFEDLYKQVDAALLSFSKKED
ncbi:MAG: AAA family ATPase [Patescibacteria group bacterium UBA2103]